MTVPSIQEIRTHHEASMGVKADFFRFGEHPLSPLRKSIECRPFMVDGRIYLVTARKPTVTGKRFTLSIYDPTTGKIETSGKSDGFLTREGAIGAAGKIPL